MTKSNEVQVNEKRRVIYYKDGAVANYNNVKWFDASGSWLRFESDEGYIIANPENINFIKIPDIADRVV